MAGEVSKHYNAKTHLNDMLTRVDIDTKSVATKCKMHIGHERSYDSINSK